MTSLFPEIAKPFYFIFSTLLTRDLGGFTLGGIVLALTVISLSVMILKSR